MCAAVSWSMQGSIWDFLGFFVQFGLGIMYREGFWEVVKFGRVKILGYGCTNGAVCQKVQIYGEISFLEEIWSIVRGFEW